VDAEARHYVHVPHGSFDDQLARSPVAQAMQSDGKPLVLKHLGCGLLSSSARARS
jgi:hypothetical protein